MVKPCWWVRQKQLVKPPNLGPPTFFALQGETWTQTAQLLPQDGQSQQDFGASVVLEPGVALIGAPGDNEQGHQTGAAYIFLQRGQSWQAYKKLLAPQAQGQSLFGTSVALGWGTA